MFEIVGFLLIFLGVMAFLVSAIGLIRMPDIYTRMHVGTKSTTVGTMLVLIGACFIEPTWSFKLILLVIFIFLTNPLSSSVIARASHRDGHTLDRDDMKDAE